MLIKGGLILEGCTLVKLNGHISLPTLVVVYCSQREEGVKFTQKKIRMTQTNSCFFSFSFFFDILNNQSKVCVICLIQRKFFLSVKNRRVERRVNKYKRRISIRVVRRKKRSDRCKGSSSTLKSMEQSMSHMRKVHRHRMQCGGPRRRILHSRIKKTGRRFQIPICNFQSHRNFWNERPSSFPSILGLIFSYPSFFAKRQRLQTLNRNPGSLNFLKPRIHRFYLFNLIQFLFFVDDLKALSAMLDNS